jgi:ADP-ribose pyrophosphatase
MWEILHKEKIGNDPHLRLIKERVKTHKGEELDWYRFEDTGDSVAIMAQDQEGRFLLVREFSYPPQEWVIDFPGGGAPYGEDLIEAANRELAEEGGYRGAHLVKIGTYLGHRRRSTAIMHIFLATGLTPATGKQDAGEEIEIFWATESEIDTMIQEGKINSPRVLCSWLYYKYHCKKL